MTEKKERILQAALRLFAEQGYNGTSTSKIAKAAKVSEALIFRHFENKEGLLKGVLAQGEEKAKLMFADIVLENDPKVLIKKTLEMPFDKPKEAYDFWRLQFKLKWELNISGQDKMKPLEVALKNAFEELQYANPIMEAAFIIHFLDGISGAILREGLQNETAMKNFLLAKYQLT